MACNVIFNVSKNRGNFLSLLCTREEALWEELLCGKACLNKGYVMVVTRQPEVVGCGRTVQENASHIDSRWHSDSEIRVICKSSFLTSL
jgi:hypothetical protein